MMSLNSHWIISLELTDRLYKSVPNEPVEGSNARFTGCQPPINHKKKNKKATRGEGDRREQI